MKIRILGPLDCVTGSCTWVRDDISQTQFLVDCGMRQGEGDPDAFNRAPWPFEPAELAFVVLTHAHLDHCGLLPRLVRDGFQGRVHCTPETAALARIVLDDAARHHDAPYARKHVRAVRFAPHGSEGQVYDRPFPLARDLFVSYYRAAHVLGAATVQISAGPIGTDQQRLTFSGDLGGDAEGAPLTSLLRHRMYPRPGDLAIVESTYGGIVRPTDEDPREKRLETLREHLDRVVLGQGGVLLLPCFAVDRTQQVLFDLHELFAIHGERYGRVPVFVHASMACKVNRVYAQALASTENTRRGVKPMHLNKLVLTRFGLDAATPGDLDLLGDMIREMLDVSFSPAAGLVSQRRQQSSPVVRNWRRIYQEVNVKDGGAPTDGPAVIVTGSGMCNGGPVVHYLPEVLRDSRSAVLFTGYMSRGTLGQDVLVNGSLAEAERAISSHVLSIPAGTQRTEILLPVRQIRATVGKLEGYSAHADQRSLLDWLFNTHQGFPAPPGRRVFVVHGQSQARRALAAAIGARSQAEQQFYGDEARVEAEVPTNTCRWFDLDTDRWMDTDAYSTEDALRDQVAQLQFELARFQRKAVRSGDAVGGTW